MIKIELPVRYLQAIALFAARRDVRYYLNGVAINNEHLVATNGHHCGAIPLTTDMCEDIMDVNIIIPLETINTFLKGISTADKKKYNCEIGIGIEGLVTLNFRDTSITTKGIDGRYPDWQRVVVEVEEPVPHGGFNWEYMVLFQKACNILTKDKIGGVELRTNGTNAAQVKFHKCTEFKGTLMPMKL